MVVRRGRISKQRSNHSASEGEPAETLLHIEGNPFARWFCLWFWHGKSVLLRIFRQTILLAPKVTVVQNAKMTETARKTWKNRKNVIQCTRKKVCRKDLASMKRRRKINPYTYSRHRRGFAFFRYSFAGIYYGVFVFKVFWNRPTFFRSYAENTTDDYIPERSVQPMKEKTPDIRTPA